MIKQKQYTQKERKKKKSNHKDINCRNFLELIVETYNNINYKIDKTLIYAVPTMVNLKDTIDTMDHFIYSGFEDE